MLCGYNIHSGQIGLRHISTHITRPCYIIEYDFYSNVTTYLYSVARLVSERCEAVIVTGPWNTVGFVGDTAVLQCRTNESKWTVYWSTFFDGMTIASSAIGVHGDYPRLSLNDSTDGQFDLVINSTRSEDAGTYVCTEGFEDSTSAQLVLLGKCFVSFVTNLVMPKLNWYCSVNIFVLTC